MARGINKVILIGNLGRDPEVRYTQAGKAVANFTIATSESWRDRQSNEMQERTEWHRVVCFDRLGEIAGEYLKKGSKVYIEGRLQTRSWEGQDGQTRYTTEVVTRDLQMLDSRAGGGDGYRPPADEYDRGGSGGDLPSRGNEPTVVDGADDDMEDDIPF